MARKQVVKVKVAIPFRVNVRGRVKTVRTPVTAKFTRFTSPLNGIITTRVEAKDMMTLVVALDPADGSVTGLIPTLKFKCEGRSEQAVWKKLVKAGWLY